MCEPNTKKYNESLLDAPKRTECKTSRINQYEDSHVDDVKLKYRHFLIDIKEAILPLLDSGGKYKIAA